MLYLLFDYFIILIFIEINLIFFYSDKIYNNLLLGVLAVPLALTLRNIPPGSLIIQVGVIVVAFAFTTFILFFDIWHGIFN